MSKGTRECSCSRRSNSTNTSSGRFGPGAGGFLLKRSSPEDLTAAIKVVAEGESLLAPSVTRRLIEEFVSRPDADGAAVPSMQTLTQREREVLTLVATGLSNGEVATRLFISEATVKTHVKRILMKLGLRDRVQAVVAAYEAGLIRTHIQ